MTYAVVAGQSGCLSLAVIFGALLLGLWLDSVFHVKGPFVIGALLLSIPVSLYFLVRIAMGAVRAIDTTPPVKPGRQDQPPPAKEE